MIYIIPTATKPIKVVYKNPSCTVELDGDNIISRPSIETEIEGFANLIKLVKPGEHNLLDKLYLKDHVKNNGIYTYYMEEQNDDHRTTL